MEGGGGWRWERAALKRLRIAIYHPEYESFAILITVMDGHSGVCGDQIMTLSMHYVSVVLTPPPAPHQHSGPQNQPLPNAFRTMLPKYIP